MASSPTTPSTTSRPESAFGLDFIPRGRVFPSPADWRDVVMYQFMIDRFDDDKDRPPFDPKTELPRGEIDPGRGSRWQGGTLKGATRRLDYLKDMGVNAVWVSPPFKTRRNDEHGYHGYGIQDFLDIDPRFGTTGDFVDFVKTAHDRGIHVVLDVVIDHTADVWGYADPGVTYAGGRRFDIGGWHEGDPEKDFGPDEGIWPRELQDPDAFNRMGPMNDVGSASGAESKDGDFMSLKVLDLGNPATMTAVINVFKYWIAVADVDGFRIDALRHIRHGHASDFCHAIREYALSIGKKNFFLVGEVADSDEEMARYVGSNVELVESERDASTDPDNTGDYPFINAVIDFFYHRQWDAILRGERPASDARGRYEYLRARYRSFGDAGRHYLIFIENHDQGDVPYRRFLSGTQGDNPDQNRPGGDVRLAGLASVAMLTSLGIPCLYYGTEQGFDGGGDADTYVRECMFGGAWGPYGTGDIDAAAGGKAPHFFDQTHPAYVLTKKLADVRRAEPALRYGRMYFRDISGDGIHFGPPQHPGSPFAYSRVLDHTAIVIAINPSKDDADVCVAVDGNLNPPGATLRDLLNDRDVTVEKTDEGVCFARLTLPARTASLLRLRA